MNRITWTGLAAAAMYFGWLGGAVLAGADGTRPATAQNVAVEPTTAERVDFNSQVRPIFNSHCIGCHGGVKQAANLSFIRRDSLVVEAESGEIPVRPGDAKGSELIRRVTADEDERMPPADHGKALTAEEIDILRRWIDQGAQYDEHWAYVAPVPPDAPRVAHERWIIKPLDRFVLARIESEKLRPAAPADRREWLRRVSFDLTGLPPTPEEVEAFVLDNSADAYEKVVDRLLASPAYGERWTAVWLDLARYADTVGFERDPHRNIWPYKDWLIRAFNADMPFDEFTIKQLAGDLLDDPTIDDLVATSFHRNTQTNTEGGTDDEEFRVQAVIDRVNTTWQVWQATTFGCTQCHSHPYAPIDHDEYYQFMAIFNGTRDGDVIEEYPLLAVPRRKADWKRALKLDREIAELRRSLFEQVAAVNQSESQAWNCLPIDLAVLNQQGAAQLRIVESDEGMVEVVAEGTIANGPIYTLQSRTPAAMRGAAPVRLTALKIEVLPKDLEAALRTPEPGFVLSHLKALVVPGEGEPREVAFETVMADEAEPIVDPEGSLDEGRFGWSAYTRLSRPTSAIFLLREPVELGPNDKLRLQLKQSVATDGSLAMIIRRARFFVSGSDGWSRLVNDDAFRSQRSELADLRKRRAEIASINIPIVQELCAEQQRKTYIFERGNWLDKGQEVEPGTPALFPPMHSDRPPDRLAMAKWLVSPENPLTARVMVNRVWAELFGVGIVETLEDFGSSGESPSHAQLLDSLAIQFRGEMAWSLKRLLREMVLSATYRQSAHADKELYLRDPDNRLLARGPRNRLSAEMVRDQALSVSGLLSRKMYGPPVMPPQPEGVWRSVYNGAKWTTSEGEDRYRRAVYTYWKRTSGYPSMMAFDAPSREVCSARRIVTNTPLQALATLNDEAQMEFAAALAARMKREAGDDLEAQIQRAYVIATTAAPSVATVRDLVALYEAAKKAYENEPQAAEKLGQSPDEAARALVANAILNLDATLTK